MQLLSSVCIDFNARPYRPGQTTWTSSCCTSRFLCQYVTSCNGIDWCASSLWGWTLLSSGPDCWLSGKRVICFWQYLAHHTPLLHTWLFCTCGPAWFHYWLCTATGTHLCLRSEWHRSGLWWISKSISKYCLIVDLQQAVIDLQESQDLLFQVGLGQ